MDLALLDAEPTAERDAVDARPRPADLAPGTAAARGGPRRQHGRAAATRRARGGICCCRRSARCRSASAGSARAGSTTSASGSTSRRPMPTASPPSTRCSRSSRSPRRVVHVCDDIACRCDGADALVAQLEERFGPEGELSGGRLGHVVPQPVPRPVRPGAGGARRDRRRRAAASGRRRRRAPADVLALLADGEPAPSRGHGASAGGRRRAAAAAAGRRRRPRRASTTTARTAATTRCARAIELGPEGVIREVNDSKLLGRGGAAFPTGRKWEAVARQPARPHYLVCNADESEPGTFKDRVLMEGDPFALDRGDDDRRVRDRLRARLPLHARRVPAGAARASSTRIDEARRRGFLGAGHAGRGLRVRHRDAAGAGAYICGEETAIFNSIEGYRGEPRNKPPFPVDVGPVRQADGGQQRRDARQRARHRPRAAARRTPRSAPSSRRARSCSASPATSSGPGVYEVPFGTTLRELLELAGGVPAAGRCRRSCSAARRASFVAPDELDMPLTFEGARAAGATLGSGVVMVFDDTVDLGRHPAAHRRVLPRRVVRPVRAVPRRDRAPGGGARPARRGRSRAAAVERELALLAEIGQCMRDASICGLGPDGLERDRVGDRPASGCSREERRERRLRDPHRRAWSSSRSTGSRCRSPRARRSSTPAGSSASTPRRSATSRRCSRSTCAASAWSSSRARACSCRPARARSSRAWWSDRLRARAALAASWCSSSSRSSVDLSTTPVAPRLLERYDAEPERYGPPAPPARDRDRRARPPRRARRPDAATVHQPVKVDNDLYVRDYAKCILCYKCVEACGERAEHVRDRRRRPRLRRPHLDRVRDPLPDSACVYCGNCIAVCPTGALMLSRARAARGRRLGRGRADRHARPICPYCGVGCNLELHVQDNEIVKVTRPDDHDVTRGNLCIKGRFGFQHVRPRPQGRVRDPSFCVRLRASLQHSVGGRHLTSPLATSTVVPSSRSTEPSVAGDRSPTPS